MTKIGENYFRTYNLRSKNTHCSTTDADGSRYSRINDIYYPQLQIDTQKSPKCLNRRSAYSAKESSIPTSSPSASAQSAEAHSRLCAVDDSLRSDFKRPYPQLGINIKKSPRSVNVEEKPQPSSRLRKRKINFSENTSTSDGSFDISSVTVRWKKRLKPAAPVTKEFSDSLPMDTDINSQKYSLKIQFNVDELEEQMYSDMLLKKPAIVLKRINLDTVAKEPESLLPSESLTVNASDTVQENEHQNSQTEVEMSESQPVTENLKSGNELMPKTIHRKRLGMQIRGQKFIKGQIVGSIDLSQEKTVEGIIAVEEADQSTSVTSDRYIIKADTFIEQSDASDENTDDPLLSKQKCIDTRDVSVNFTNISELSFGKSKEKSEMVVEYNDNHETIGSNERLQFTNRPDKLKTIGTRRLLNAGENIDEQSTSRIRRKKSRVSNADKYSKRAVHSKPLHSVDMGELSQNEDKKTMELKNANNAENFKLKDVTVKLKAVNVAKFVSNNESAVINTAEQLHNLENSPEFETIKDLESTVVSSNMDPIHLNEPQKADFVAPDANSATKVTYISSDKSYLNQVADVSKPCFIDSDDDVIVIISDDESYLGASSSGSTINLNYTPALSTSSEADATNVRLIYDKKIERIALNSINQTTTSSNPASNPTIKFTEMSETKKAPNTQELGYSIKVIESRSTEVDEPVPNTVNLNSIRSLTNSEQLEHLTSDDEELVLSDDDTHLKPITKKIFISHEEIANRSEATTNKQSVIDETIKFTELECEDVLNDVELLSIEINSDKSTVKEVSSTSANDIPKNNFEVCPQSFKPTKSQVFKVVADNPQEFNDADGKCFSDSEQVHSPERQKLSNANSLKCGENARQNFRSQRSGRAVKSLRWAVDEFDSGPSTSGQSQRYKTEASKKIDAQHTSLLSVSLFTSTANPNDIQSPTVDHLLNCSQTQELFSPWSPTKISQSSDEDIVQICCSNENAQVEPEDWPLSSTKKTGTPSSLETVPASKINYKFDNSIWYSSDEENDDNRVYSLYQNESVLSSEVISFPESQLHSPKGEDPVAGSIEKLSSQEPNNSDSDIVLCSQSPDPVSQFSKDILVDDSPVAAKGCRERILHSTPTGRRLKKSPSPTYTPIYKRLMLKVINDEEKRTHRESKMEDIKEEVENKAANISSSLMVRFISSRTFFFYFFFLIRLVLISE